MNAHLYWMIDQAESYANDACDFETVIVELSTHKSTVAALLEAYRDRIIASELMWQETEQTAAFKEEFDSRTAAKIAFHRVASAVPKDD